MAVAPGSRRRRCPPAALQQGSALHQPTQRLQGEVALRRADAHLGSAQQQRPHRKRRHRVRLRWTACPSRISSSAKPPHRDTWRQRAGADGAPATCGLLMAEAHRFARWCGTGAAASAKAAEERRARRRRRSPIADAVPGLLQRLPRPRARRRTSAVAHSQPAQMGAALLSPEEVQTAAVLPTSLGRRQGMRSRRRSSRRHPIYRGRHRSARRHREAVPTLRGQPKLTAPLPRRHLPRWP
mmetsp:Transcript_71779/g.207894  ORF Transcript_71779/g.207894 Transcript_71779/m.207894 type:complete len:240 (+) Transcript_71779:983-1702(+)